MYGVVFFFFCFGLSHRIRFAYKKINQNLSKAQVELKGQF